MNLLFDFDGTIADTYALVMELFAELKPKYHLSPQTAATMRSFRELTVKQVIAGSGLSLIQLPFFLKDMEAAKAARLHLVKPIDGLVDILKILHQAGHTFGIVTSSTKENVTSFLAQNNLTDLFKFIHSEKNLWGKAAAFKHVMAKYQLDLNKTIYLGDETRDIEAAHEVDLRIIAVGWGFNSPKFLKTFQPEYLIEKPEELLKIITDLAN